MPHLQLRRQPRQTEVAHLWLRQILNLHDALRHFDNYEFLLLRNQYRYLLRLLVKFYIVIVISLSFLRFHLVLDRLGQIPRVY